MNDKEVTCKFCGQTAIIRKAYAFVPMATVDCENCGALVSFRDICGRDADIDWVYEKYTGGKSK